MSLPFSLLTCLMAAAVGSALAVSAPAPSTPQQPQVEPAAPGAERPGVLRFKRLRIKDDLMKMDAFSLLIPADWKAQGGIQWRKNPLKPAAGVLRVTSPDFSRQFEILPQMPFVDGARESAMESARAAGPGAVALMAERFAEGNLCFGNEVRRRVEDPARFTRQFVLPRFRGDLTEPRIVKEEDLQKVADGLAAAEPAEAGTRRTIRAGRTRIEFTRDGKDWEEDIYCILVLVEIPAIRQTYWGADHLFALRAQKGQLDAAAPILKTMVNSFRIELPWFNKYVQVVHSLIQGQIKEIQAIGEFSRRWAQMSDEVSQDRQKAWEDRQARYDEMNRRYGQYQRGVDEYKDADGNRVELPAGYNHGWISGNDEYIVTDNPNFNPNVELNGSWKQLEKAP